MGKQFFMPLDGLGRTLELHSVLATFTINLYFVSSALTHPELLHFS